MVALSYFRCMMKKFFVAILSFFFLSIGRAQKIYDFNTTCQQAYQEITKLKMRSGQQLIDRAKLQNPDNLIPLLLESYIDMYVLFLNEDAKDLEIRYPKFSQRIDQLQEGPKSSPYYLFCLSIVRIHRAETAIKFGKLWDAAWDFRKGYQLIKENKKAFPRFVPNDLVFGSLQAVVGTIPKGYKWIASLFGLKGSLTEGMKT